MTALTFLVRAALIAALAVFMWWLAREAFRAIDARLKAHVRAALTRYDDRFDVWGDDEPVRQQDVDAVAEAWFRWNAR